MSAVLRQAVVPADPRLRPATTHVCCGVARHDRSEMWILTPVTRAPATASLSDT